MRTNLNQQICNCDFYTHYAVISLKFIVTSRSNIVYERDKLKINYDSNELISIGLKACILQKHFPQN